MNRLSLRPLAALALLPLVATAALPAPEPVKEFVTTPEMKRETMATVWSLENQHILRRRIADFSMDELVTDFAAKLDPARLFFLAPDVAKARQRHAVMLDVWLENGNLAAPFAMYKDYMTRLDERVAWINARLDRPFDFSASETFNTDRAKAAWPASPAAADALWEKRLKYDLLLEILGAGDGEEDAGDEAAAASAPKPPPKEITAARLDAAKAKLKKRYARMRHYLAMEPSEIEELFLNTLGGRYDPHTTFFSKQSLEEFDIAMRNSLCGVGALLADEDGYCTVKELMPGGPLERDGTIKPGDRIVAFGEGTEEPEDLVGMRLNKVVRKMRGAKGTPIALVIEPAADRTARRTIHLKRDEIKLTTQLASARVFEVPGADGAAVPLGVIELPAFYGKTDAEGEAYSTTENVEELIRKLKALKVRGIVMDLRNNGGGLLNEAVDLAGLFIPTGPVLQVKDFQGQLRHHDDEDPKVAWDGPLVILVAKTSASASEIFAGALKDHRRAIIVGDPQTHGKGSVQAVLQYSRLDSRLKAAAKVTIQKWYLPSGNSIQLKGVTADIPVPSVYSVLPVSESDLERPLPWDSIPSVLDPAKIAADHTTVRVNDALLADLGAASASRRDRLEEFLPLARSVTWTGERYTNKEQSLNFVERRRSRLDDIAFRDALKTDLTKLADAGAFKATEVKLDAAIALERKDPNAAKSAQKSLAGRKGRGAALQADDTWPDFDVQLRESLRILGDWTARAPAAPASAPVKVARTK